MGKSTLLSNLAGVYSEVAAYEFTTLTTVPGVIKYKGAKIQLLDLPGIIEGAKDGKGRGKQVIAGVIFELYLPENFLKKERQQAWCEHKEQVTHKTRNSLLCCRVGRMGIMFFPVIGWDRLHALFKNKHFFPVFLAEHGCKPGRLHVCVVIVLGDPKPWTPRPPPSLPRDPT